MSDSKPKLSIIINHHRTPNVLKMCLDSIKAKFSGVSHEIIVTDSETEEKTTSMLKEYHPDIFFIANEENCGFSRSVNPALEKSKGDYIFSINADIILEEKDSIQKLMKYLDEHEDVGVLGPKLLNIDGSVQHTYFREYTFLTVLARRTSFGKTKWGKSLISSFTYGDKKTPKEPVEVDWLMGSAYMMKRDRLEKVGSFFDDRFFMYFEDVDLSRRFRENKMKVIYYPKVTFTHYHIRASHGGRGYFDIFSNWLTRVHIQSYLKYLWKWGVEKKLNKS